MFTDLVLTKDINNMGYSNILQVEIIKPKTVKDLHKIQKSKELVVVEGGKFNRELLENKNVDILLSPEKDSQRDFLNQRDSGLNQVLCKLAKKNRIAIGFNFNDVLNSNKKHKIIGKMMQNIRLCRKYKLDIVIGSFASNSYELRNPNDLMAFFTCIGMNSGEAKRALSKVPEILKRKKNLIIEGIELLE